MRLIKHHLFQILAFSFVLALALSLQNYYMGPKEFWGGTYTHYNNYLIFKYSFIHLITDQNCYALHLQEHADYYKYSPSFAVFMAPFWYLPDVVGLSAWNFLNIFIALLGLNAVVRNRKWFWLCQLMILPELVVTTQNSQSNALIGGLLLLAYSAMPRPGKSALYVSLALFIKPFALAFYFLVFYFKQPFRFLGWSALCVAVLLLLPILFIGCYELQDAYQNWYELLKMDEQQSSGYSIYALGTVVGISSKLPLLLAGVILLVLPLLPTFEPNQSQVLFICQMLLWMVVFNFKAESPTYILAILACAIWMYHFRSNSYVLALACMCFVLVSLVKMDFIPEQFRAPSVLQYLAPSMPLVIMLIIAGQSLKGTSLFKKAQRP